MHRKKKVQIDLPQQNKIDLALNFKQKCVKGKTRAQRKPASQLINTNTHTKKEKRGRGHHLLTSPQQNKQRAHTRTYLDQLLNLLNDNLTEKS